MTQIIKCPKHDFYEEVYRLQDEIFWKRWVCVICGLSVKTLEARDYLQGKAS